MSIKEIIVAIVFVAAVIGAIFAFSSTTAEAQGTKAAPIAKKTDVVFDDMKLRTTSNGRFNGPFEVFISPDKAGNKVYKVDYIYILAMGNIIAFESDGRIIYASNFTLRAEK